MKNQNTTSVVSVDVLITSEKGEDLQNLQEPLSSEYKFLVLFIRLLLILSSIRYNSLFSQFSSSSNFLISSSSHFFFYLIYIIYLLHTQLCNFHFFLSMA
jgi:hypothetical protein